MIGPYEPKDPTLPVHTEVKPMFRSVRQEGLPVNRKPEQYRDFLCVLLDSSLFPVWHESILYYFVV